MTGKGETERKQFIKETARKLFNRFGYQKTSLDDIARQCGLAKPTLYYYYPNKEAIFDEIVLEDARLIFRNVEAAIDPHLPADQKFILFAKSIYENLKLHARQIQHVPDNFIEYSPHGRPIVEKIRELFKAKLRRILQEGLEQGLFAIDDVELTLTTIMSMTEFVRIRWILQQPETECDKIVDEMNRIFLSGLIKR
ncbi:MAG: TetR/AcrR family transcriptional regulator [Calditrichia bacterium]